MLSFTAKPRGWVLNAAAGVFIAVASTAIATEPPSQDEAKTDPDAPRFISPDGRYGMLVTKDPDPYAGSDRVELIEVATKRSLVVLNDPEAPERSGDARLDWSKDSTRVAAYTGGRVSGSTRLFVREGDGFVEVKLPRLPNLPNPEEPSAAFRKKHKFKFLKWITTDSLEFVQWLDSGEVELKAYNEVETEEGRGFRAEINLTLAIDAKHRATLKKAVRKESLE